MAISCVAADLVEASKCYACLSKEERESVMIYLLAQLAGEDATSTADLAEAAKAYRALSGPMAKAVQNYLLCQIANAGA